LSSAHAIQLSLAQNYSGSTFFDAWSFYNGIDANTTGNVLYQTREQAASEGLAFVNSAGHAIMKVDNTTSGTNDPTFGRPSVKILSNATVSAGSLVLMDAVHMPFGCSVWPAFWMQGVNWPTDGEIDIVEQVNVQTNNRYTLHTLDGCMHPAASAGTLETGTVVSTDCFNATNGDEGCIIEDPSANSFGAGFASNGGGVFAMLWDDTGIKIWFFNRSSIPTDLPTASPNPSIWTTPTAFFPSSSCDTSKFFGPQTLIFDTTICGNFAGAADVFNPTCSGTCTDLVATASNYNNAYFEIAYVRVFSNGSDLVASSSSSATSAKSTSGSTTSTSNALQSVIATTLATALAVVGVMVVTVAF
jgi:hypothetical protein